MPYLVAAFSRRTDLPLWFTTRLDPHADQWSHCGLVVEATVGGVNGFMVVDARMGVGVLPTPLHLWRARYPHVALRVIECPDPARGQAKAWSLIGAEYDLAGTVDAAIGIGDEDPTKPYCAELVRDAVTQAGRAVRIDLPRPQQLFDISEPLTAANDPFDRRLEECYA